jgi:GST-like protein
MIDFYALTSPNVQKVFIMLEECGLPYNIKPVDVWAGEQFTPEFATINPLLKVPAIVDSDGPGGKPYTVIESGAILIYLAEKTGKFIPHEPVARYETLQWVILQVANL